MTAFYEALTVILKADMDNYKHALITLSREPMNYSRFLRLNKMPVENMLQSLTSRGLSQIMKTFEYLESESVRKLSVVLLV